MIHKRKFFVTRGTMCGLSYVPQKELAFDWINVTCKSCLKSKKITTKVFSKEIAKVMLDLKSSHVYFIIQQAFGDIGWEDAEDILQSVIKEK